MCPSSVRYIFLRNHLTDFDETLHALCTLPDDVKNAKKISISQKKNFDLAIFFTIFFELIFFGRLDRFRQTQFLHTKIAKILWKSRKKEITQKIAKILRKDCRLMTLCIVYVLYTPWRCQKREKKSIFAKNYHSNFAIFS